MLCKSKTKDTDLFPGHSGSGCLEVEKVKAKPEAGGHNEKAASLATEGRRIGEITLKAWQSFEHDFCLQTLLCATKRSENRSKPRINAIITTLRKTVNPTVRCSGEAQGDLYAIYCRGYEGMGPFLS